jgi:hypothetical protein
MLQKLGCLCPTFDRIQDLFPDSPKLCSVVSGFYAIVVVFCTEAIQIFQKNGAFRSSNFRRLLLTLGLIQFAKI